MYFKTNVDIVNGSYGRWESTGQGKPKKFVPMGKAATLIKVTSNIEDNTVILTLSFNHLGDYKVIDLPRSSLRDINHLEKLIDIGVDVTSATFSTFVDSIRLQEARLEATGFGTDKVYSHPGWKSLPTYDSSGAKVGSKLCYRAGTMVGGVIATYIGNLKLAPMGSFDAWKQMTENEILGHTPGEVALLAGLSAVPNGLISTCTTGENSIWSFTGVSTSGKSTLGMACASAYGEPFDGEYTVYNSDGVPSRLMSVYGSWSSTTNAVIGRCSGNRGCVVVLNEVGKFVGDMTPVLYNLAEGTDRVRLTKDLKPYQAEGFTTTFISIGEHSILDCCKSKADGLRCRVMELDMPLTTSAASADRIKAVCRKNNGHAAPMMAEYIINNGGIKMVIDIYEHYRKALLNIWPETPFKERFISKFPAMILTTAKLAEAALGITFNEPAIIDFFLEREATHGQDRNSAAKSYDTILSHCRIQKHRFYVRTDRSAKNAATFDQPSIPNNECWGRITYTSKLWCDSQVIVQEIEIRKEVAERILRENGFSNKKTCITAWKAANVLDYLDDTHPCRKRKIDPAAPEGTTEPVYVFRVFCDPADVDKHWAASVEGSAEWQKKQLQILPLKSKVDIEEEVERDDTQNVEPA